MLKASLFALVSMLLLVLTATAEPTADPDGDIAADDGISGREIYERVREHRLFAFEAEAKLTTGDGYGKEEESQFSIRWKDFSNGNSHGDERGILSKTFIQFTEPYEYLYAGYMVVNKVDGMPNDQFAYFSALRRTIRVNLRGVPLYGTDFNFSGGLTACCQVSANAGAVAIVTLNTSGWMISVSTGTPSASAPTYTPGS